MRFSEKQAYELFSIFVVSGNIRYGMLRLHEMREEFIEQATSKEGIEEYLFDTVDGSEILVTFKDDSDSPVSVSIAYLAEIDDYTVESLKMAIAEYNEENH